MKATIPEHLQPAVDWTRHRKNEVVSETTVDENDDLAPALLITRDDAIVATILCRNVDRDEGLAAASLAIPGYSADELLFIVDAHMSHHLGPDPSDPDRKWAPREMQRFCDEQGACETGLITDTMQLIRLTRKGLAETISLPYHVHKQAREVRWIDDAVEHLSTDEPSVRLEGFVPDTLRSFFGKGDLMDLFGQMGMPSAADFGLTPSEARAHADAAVTKLLVAHGYAVMYQVADEECARIVKDSLNEFGVETIDIDH